MNKRNQELEIENKRLKRENENLLRRLQEVQGDSRDFNGYTIKNDGTVLAKNGKPLKLRKNYRRCKNTYDLEAALTIDGKKRYFRVHRLVAQCFIGPVDGMEVNHIDKDTTNNHVKNLEIVTSKQNKKHRKDFNFKPPEDMPF